MQNDLAQAIIQSAQRLNVNPVDLGTVISYETAGTFDPWKAGPTTQWGQHRGLIQWGEPQRKQYGVYQGQPVADQMRAVERYLADAGFKPGMGIMDMYSAINAGRVGRYNASDANNGGAPGTVADKVNNQMGGHRRKAEQLLAGKFTPGPASTDAAPARGGIASMFTPAGPAMPGAEVAGAPVPPTLGALAALFAQQQTKRNEERAAEAEAEQMRRAALFSPDSLAGLFGAA